ncbi:multiple epidermal growth factor-like domains protein 10, partial [Saccostrea cucullata]|uniref:multiple epidermal growth factor-like domains protein 10 n=1 Tax=Saccostrea cuccullata TaxID=36930 RepID=UPI002ED4D2A9
CVTGHYGTICENLCGKCVNGTHCDQNTGICPQGCEDNWQGQTCNECQDYKYGPNCTLNCGFCKNNTTCSKINGTCGNGCETGWSGALCQKLYTAEELEDHWILKIPSIITLSGSAFFVVTLVCLVVRVVCKKRKQNRTQKMQEECSRNSVSKIEKVHYVCGEPDLKGDKQSYNSSSQDYTNDNMSIYENIFE